jgi:peptidoglycan-associated lipoprotein
MASRSRRSYFAVIAVLLLIAGCGKKRPPAVATGGGTDPRTEATSRPEPRLPESLDAGPDVQPIEGEGLGMDALESELGEGGPLADVQFGYDQANLSDEARATLEKHALWLQNHRDVKVQIEGHCDERGTVEYNLALGDARAQAARDYVLSLGVSPDRLSTVSYGKERPIDPGHDESAWAKNRRAHFKVQR